MKFINLASLIAVSSAVKIEGPGWEPTDIKMDGWTFKPHVTPDYVKKNNADIIKST